MLGDRNLEILTRVAERLASSSEDFVYVGGAIVGLLVTDPAAARPRPTDDVDVIVQVAGFADYQTRLIPELKRLGLKEDIDAKTVCRWLLDGVKVDVMPTNDAILGFSNRWYPDAITSALTTAIGGTSLRVISAPYFIGTKLEAFRSRGGEDYYESHDLEDILVVVDGRPEIVEEIAKSDGEVRAYIAGEVGKLVAIEDFVNALPGLVSERDRSEILLRRMQAIAALEA